MHGFKKKKCHFCLIQREVHFGSQSCRAYVTKAFSLQTVTRTKVVKRAVIKFTSYSCGNSSTPLISLHSMFSS